VPVASGLYRILQEALANVLKHAEATRVVVELSFESDTVKLTVGDDGIGFDGGGIDPGYGLDNMRQRTDEMNGTLEISGGPGEGTTINVTLPSREV
jgi:signal transduction histidine kinase